MTYIVQSFFLDAVTIQPTFSFRRILLLLSKLKKLKLLNFSVEFKSCFNKDSFVNLDEANESKNALLYSTFVTYFFERSLWGYLCTLNKGFKLNYLIRRNYKENVSSVLIIGLLAKGSFCLSAYSFLMPFFSKVIDDFNSRASSTLSLKKLKKKSDLSVFSNSFIFDLNFNAVFFLRHFFFFNKYFDSFFSSKYYMHFSFSSLSAKSKYLLLGLYRLID